MRQLRELTRIRLSQDLPNYNRRVAEMIRSCGPTRQIGAIPNTIQETGELCYHRACDPFIREISLVTNRTRLLVLEVRPLPKSPSA